MIGKRGIEQFGSSSGSIFLLFSMKVAGPSAHSSRGKYTDPGFQPITLHNL